MEAYMRYLENLELSDSDKLYLNLQLRTSRFAMVLFRNQQSRIEVIELGVFS